MKGQIQLIIVSESIPIALDELWILRVMIDGDDVGSCQTGRIKARFCVFALRFRLIKTLILSVMTFKHPETSVFRVLDAAINRAGEGIRVVEDYVRMQLGDAHLSIQLKQLRHDLTASVKQIDTAERIASRDSVGDVGRTLKVDSEYQRTDSNETDGKPGFSNGMIQANMARTQQAFRTIEEFSKTIDREIAQQVEQLRYRAYTLEKAVLTTVVSLQNLSGSNLYVLIDAGGFDGSPEKQVEGSRLKAMVLQLIEAEVNLIQLRDKSLTDRQLVAAGQLISTLTRGSKTRFIVNDRSDLALASLADGVHLGQDDLPVAEARRVLGAARLIGVSTHTIEQARQAVLDGANYIGVGPVFHSSTKKFDSLMGLEFVKQVADEIQLPAFAIGGIDLANVDRVLQAGLGRVAIGGAIIRSDRPIEAARHFKRTLATNCC